MGGFFSALRYIAYYPFEGFIFAAALIFAAVCSIRVSTTFSKYNLVRTKNGVHSQEVARAILDNNGLYDVQIVRCAGKLTDHYDPRNKTLALSDTVYNNSSVGAIGVAAHECGHAIQHEKGYTPFRIRQAMAPAVSLCSRSWIFVMMIGCFLNSFICVQIAIAFLIVVALFQIVTLPVEIDASRRAIDTLAGDHLLYGEELLGARKVLSAAAMTYAASLLTTLAQLFRIIMSTTRRK